MRVKSLAIREIFATTSKKTIEVELQTSKGIVRSSVPLGTSRSGYEVIFLPVEDVIRKFVLIQRHFRTQQFESLEGVDSLLRTIDKTSNFREIGGNLALAISSAFLKAFALEAEKEVFEFLSNELKIKPKMPMPLSIVAGGWVGQSDIQEFLLLPVHQRTFLSSITKLSEAYLELGKRLQEADPNFIYAKNIESAWATSLHFEKVLQILKKIANEKLLKIGLDMAASQLWDGTHYSYRKERLTRPEQMNFVADLAKRYPIAYIEDPFHENDFLAFATLTHRLQQKLVCGDDLYATNPQRLKAGLEQKATNAIVIKPNQVGTISDTIKVVKEAKKAKLATVMSHRSGETEDTLICHLAVGLGCDYIKLGISGERTVKINEMLRIEERLGRS